MRTNMNNISLLAILILVTYVNQVQAKDVESVDMREVSYALGYHQALANNDKRYRIDLEAFSKGFRAAYKGRISLFSEDDMYSTFVDYYQITKQIKP